MATWVKYVIVQHQKSNILFCQNIATCSSFSRWMIYSSFLITRTTWWWWFHRIRQITRGQLSFTLRVSWLGLLIFSGFTSSLSKAKINQFEYLLLSVIQKVGWFDITFMGKRVILHSGADCLAWAKKWFHVWLEKNWVPSMLPHNLWLISMGMKEKLLNFLNF